MASQAALDQIQAAAQAQAVRQQALEQQAGAGQTASLAGLIAGYMAAKASARAQLVDTVLGVWDSLTSWRTPDIVGFSRRVAPLVTGTQAHLAALTVAFLAAQLRAAGVQPPPSPKLLTGPALRNGTPTLKVYERPGVQVWTDLSNGSTLGQAVAAGRNRARQLAETDTQLASTHAAKQVLAAAPHVVGYRRVLTGPHSCALCVVASTQRYHKADLMPIHPGCDCTVAPIVGSEDPGRVLDQGALDAAHAEISARLGTDSNKAETLRQMIVVHHHGEMGPVLAAEGQHFAGPGSIH